MKKMKTILCLFLIFVFSIMQLFSLQAAARNITLNPIEDSYVTRSFPFKNNGSNIFIETEAVYNIGDTLFGSRGYLKFDLSKIPTSATLTSAELTLYLEENNTANTTIYVYYCSDNSWNELSINWDNAPSFQPQSINSCYPVISEGWYSWRVTTAVKNALSLRALTLVVDNGYKEGEDTCWFNSKECSDPDIRPKLTIVYESPNFSPTADFTYSLSNPTIEDTIQFTDKSSDSDGTISLWSWNFGDGTTSTTQNPQHKYTTPDQYTIVLEVTDNDGAKSSISKIITIGQSEPTPTNKQPDANFSFYPTTAKINDTIQFTDASIDTDGTITSYLWTFGDGTNSTSNNPQHIYNTNGTYSITLEVTDNNGYTNLTSKTIIINKNSTNTNDNKGTPGFELIITISALLIAIILSRK